MMMKYLNGHDKEKKEIVEKNKDNKVKHENRRRTVGL